MSKQSLNEIKQFININSQAIDQTREETLKEVEEKLKTSICEGIGFGKYGFSRIEKNHLGEVAININDVLEEINQSLNNLKQ